MASPFGSFPAATHVIAHLSDPHLVADGLLYGTVDSQQHLADALVRVAASGFDLDAIVVTGDLTDNGEAGAYERLRTALEPQAAALGAQLVLALGNHDDRETFRRIMRAGEPDSTGETGPGETGPVVRVHDLGGLRVIALDTSVPGWHHGAIDAEQLHWLGEVLATPKPYGTILAMHHAPVPTPLELMQILELDGADELASLIEGTDVRAILGGHLHYPTSGLFAGIPVHVAGATCYTMDLAAGPGVLAGVDSGQTFSLLHVLPGTIASSVVPVASGTTATRFGPEYRDALAAMPSAERREQFSRQRSPS